VFINSVLSSWRTIQLFVACLFFLLLYTVWHGFRDNYLLMPLETNDHSLILPDLQPVLLPKGFSQPVILIKGLLPIMSPEDLSVDQ